MKAWEIFANENKSTSNLLRFYTELREEFKRLEFKEEDLSKPPLYSNKMWQLKSLFSSNLSSLISDIKSYGFNVSPEEIQNFLTPKLEEINKQTPL